VGKINWTRVLIGGLVAGVVGNVLWFAAWALFGRPGLSATLEALGHPLKETVGTTVLLVVMTFLMGSLAVWLYAAIRPLHGPGPTTAAAAGVAAGALVWGFPRYWMGFHVKADSGKGVGNRRRSNLCGPGHSNPARGLGL
jgi:hypothetical protein